MITIHRFIFIFDISDVDQCLQNQFTCTNRMCVANSKTCDGSNDCGDFSDEIVPCSGKYSDPSFKLPFLSEGV